jgi:hypothetical protein
MDWILSPDAKGLNRGNSGSFLLIAFRGVKGAVARYNLSIAQSTLSDVALRKYIEIIPNSIALSIHHCGCENCQLADRWEAYHWTNQLTGKGHTPRRRT